MTQYVGETLTVLAVATDPTRAFAAITTAIGQVVFYQAGLPDPSKNPSARVVEFGPFPMSFDSTVITDAQGKTIAGAYTASVPTTGWTPGQRYYMVTLSTNTDTWQFGGVKLLA